MFSSGGNILSLAAALASNRYPARASHDLVTTGEQEYTTRQHAPISWVIYFSLKRVNELIEKTIIINQNAS